MCTLYVDRRLTDAIFFYKKCDTCDKHVISMKTLLHGDRDSAGNDRRPGSIYIRRYVGFSLGSFTPGCQPFLFCSWLSASIDAIRRHSYEVCPSPRPARRPPSPFCEIDCGETACTSVETAGSIQAAASEVCVLRSQSMLGA